MCSSAFNVHQVAKEITPCEESCSKYNSTSRLLNCVKEPLEINNSQENYRDRKSSYKLRQTSYAGKALKDLDNNPLLDFGGNERAVIKDQCGTQSQTGKVTRMLYVALITWTVIVVFWLWMLVVSSVARWFVLVTASTFIAVQYSVGGLAELEMLIYTTRTGKLL